MQTMDCGWTPCRFINCNKYTALVEDVNNGRDFARVRAEDIWDIFIPSSQFCCQSKPKQ